MKKFLIGLVLGFTITFGIFFAIDAEVARIDRAAGETPTGCLFKINCRGE